MVLNLKKNNFYLKIMQYTTEGNYSFIKTINSEINAVCVLKSDRINGVVYMKEYDGKTTFTGKILGLTPNKKHGFHIHEAGDLTDGCMSACAHYNPYNKNHGDRLAGERHVGDLGNLLGDSNGACNFTFDDFLVKLSGDYSVIGRSLIIHEDEDDLGLGDEKDSLTTGHAGKRIVCGIIGYRKKC